MTSPTDPDRLWSTIHRERARLLEMLRTLDEDEWDRASLCRGWRVRDVAAHTISSSDYSTPGMLIGFVRARGDFNTMMDRLARAQGAQPVDRILARYERQATSRRRPPGTKPQDPLVDVLVHSQDIAIPLGREHPMPAAPAREAADFVWTRGFPYDAQRHHAGTRFVATDVDFAVGAGTTVSAPIADILLVMTGRPRPSR
ncbi:MAG TPA: maleylpyruvate isomerase family mycothiol-dependent enzyme [Micromonosporaceae bacterium]|jgi:uncharacterized protein (TIGR03083 family)